MPSDDVVKGGLGLKPKIASALCIKLLGPAGNNSLDKFVRFTVDTRGNLVASDAAERVDLLSDRARYTRHGKINARPELFAGQTRGMDEKTNSGTRARMGMSDGVGDRQ